MQIISVTGISTINIDRFSHGLVFLLAMDKVKQVLKKKKQSNIYLLYDIRNLAFCTSTRKASSQNVIHNNSSILIGQFWNTSTKPRIQQFYDRKA